MTNPSTTVILGASSSIWTQLALPNPPAGAVPFVFTDNTSIAIDVPNFNYDPTNATLTCFGLFATVNLALIQGRVGKAILVPITGFAYLFPSANPPNGASNAAVVDTIILSPAGVLATGTITAPLVPVNGQEIRILAVDYAITALTVLPNIGQTLHGGAAFTLAANTAASWIYDKTSNSWYRK